MAVSGSLAGVAARSELALSASSRIPPLSRSTESGSACAQEGVDLDFELHGRQRIKSQIQQRPVQVDLVWS